MSNYTITSWCTTGIKWQQCTG